MSMKISSQNISMI